MAGCGGVGAVHLGVSTGLFTPARQDGRRLAVCIVKVITVFSSNANVMAVSTGLANTLDNRFTPEVLVSTTVAASSTLPFFERVGLMVQTLPSARI